MPFELIAALRFLRDGLTQTLLIVIGVSLGVAVIVFMSALIAGLQGNIVRRTLSAQPHVVVLPPEEVARSLRDERGRLEIARVQPKGQRLRSVDQWQKVLQQVVAIPGVAHVAPLASGPGFAVRGDATRSISLIGIDPEAYMRVLDLSAKLTEGRYRLGTDETLIGTELAHDLGVGVGDKVTFTTVGGRQDTFTVSGIFDLGNKGPNERNVYVQLRSAQALLDLSGGASSIELTVTKVFDAESVAQRIHAMTGLRADSWIKTNSQLFIAINAQTFTNAVIRVFVGISAAFGIASVLAVSVVQRSREIGILRAVGATRRQIMNVFLIQGALFGVTGSVFGSMMAAGFLAAWRTIARNPDGTPLFVIETEPSLFVWAALVAGLTGLVAAASPARRASGLDPVVAIRG
jgi:lipoprotein-releasing system permease protein